MAQNPVVLGLHPFFFFAPVSREMLPDFFFQATTYFCLLNIFFSVVKTDNDNVEARLVQLLAVSSKRQGHGFKFQSWSLSPYPRRIL